MGEYKNVPQEINDVVSDNIKKLAQLFPSAVKDGQLDVNALKEELGTFEEVGKEKYEFTWSGKQNAKKIAQQDVFGKTLKFCPEKSKNADTTENIYIEGNNLEALKLLRQNYYNSIKMIYIDPPYNTGNDFVYNDDYSMSQEESDIAEGVVDELGERYTKNQKSTNRFHARWLNEMYPRLKLAKDLLTDDGVIFISIDDNEQENLKKICDEIFGASNFISKFTRKGSGGRQDSKYYAIVHEYLFCYVKNTGRFISGKIIKESDTYPFFDEKFEKYYKTQLLRKWGENSKRSDRPNLYYPITDPDGNANYPMLSDTEEGCWRWGKETMNENIKKGLVEFKKRNGKWVAYEKLFEPNEGEFKTKLYSTIIDDVSNNTGAALIKALFNTKLFDYPKPVELITRILKLGNVSDGDVILDFFSGSATTAHAVMQLNAEDGGNRKFIMVQLEEKTDEKSEAHKSGYNTICEIGEERIRRAGDKIKAEHPDADIDIGFKVFEIADTNIKWNELELKDEQIDFDSLSDTPDQIDFKQGTKDIDVVYEIMLRQKNIPLSSKIEVLDEIGSRTYLYADSYLVCLETQVTNDMIDKLASLDPTPFKYIFRDSAFKDDIDLKTNAFRRLKAMVKKHAGATKKAYTVEFI